MKKKQLIEYYSLSADKIHVIPRGVDSSLFKPICRIIEKNTPTFCSIGSIKPQKNTLALIDLFANLQLKYPKSILRIIGSSQNQQYYQQVINKIKQLGLSDKIELTGYLASDQLTTMIADCHIHISTSNCETFGRSIFETLASGMPNIARLSNNAAYDFLKNLPYIKFTRDNNEALEAIDQLLLDFPKLSSMASEIGNLYDDKRLGKLITAKICQRKTLIVSDYDGTLFHKNCYNKTIHYIKNFKQFSPRVICSARSTEGLLMAIRHYNLKVDWIISYSGAVITDARGNILFINPLLKEEIKTIINLVSEYEQIIVNDQVIQIATSSMINGLISGMNIEIYQDKKFISNWQSTKLNAICRLLDHINWQGNIQALGDGKYDLQYLSYFDGHLVENNTDISTSQQIEKL